jgi:hypothetical protein
MKMVFLKNIFKINTSKYKKIIFNKNNYLKKKYKLTPVSKRYLFASITILLPSFTATNSKMFCLEEIISFKKKNNHFHENIKKQTCPRRLEVVI